MAISILRTTIAIPIKFVMLNGAELPIPGYSAVPTERLMHLESVAMLAKDLMSAAEEARKNLSRAGIAEDVRTKLERELADLNEHWDFKSSI